MHHPDWRNFDRVSGEHPPMRGWLAVPLTGDDDGRHSGLLQLSDKVDGSDFTEPDEDHHRCLARIAEIGLSSLGREYQRAAADAPFDLEPDLVTRIGS